MVFRRERESDKRFYEAFERKGTEALVNLFSSAGIKVFQMVGSEALKADANMGYGGIKTIFDVGTDVAFYSMLGLSIYNVVEMYRMKKPSGGDNNSSGVRVC